MTFVELASFTREWQRLGLGDVELQAVQQVILANPTTAPVQQGTGGLRKLRAARGGGKSGGVRVCYAVWPAHRHVLLVLVFGKGDKANITAKEAQVIQRFMARYEQEELP